MTFPTTSGDRKADIITYADRDDQGRRQGAHAIKISSASISPDGKCVVVIGQYTWDSHYEAVQVHTPTVFAKLVCD